MPIPNPGKPKRGPKTGVPIMELIDFFGRTGSPGVFGRSRHAPYALRVLQDKCESISPTILNNRIKELKEARMVERSLMGIY